MTTTTTRRRLDALEKRRKRKNAPQGMAAWYRALEADPELMAAFYGGQS